MRLGPVTTAVPMYGPTTLAVLASLLVLATFPAHAQTPPSPHALKVEAEVHRLHPGDKMSIIPRDAPEIFATLTATGADSFDCQDVDEHIPRHFTFEAVRKVKPGYGGYNYLHHRHTDRTANRVVLIAVVAGLATLIVAAAAAQ